MNSLSQIKQSPEAQNAVQAESTHFKFHPDKPNLYSQSVSQK